MLEQLKEVQRAMRVELANMQRELLLKQRAVEQAEITTRAYEARLDKLIVQLEKANANG